MVKSILVFYMLYYKSLRFRYPMQKYIQFSDGPNLLQSDLCIAKKSYFLLQYITYPLHNWL